MHVPRSFVSIVGCLLLALSSDPVGAMPVVSGLSDTLPSPVLTVALERHAVRRFRGGGFRAGGVRFRGGGVGYRGGFVRRAGFIPGRTRWQRPGYGPRRTNIFVRRNVVVGGVYRPYGAWWRPGAAIAAGAAIGFVSAATAAAWAGSPPASGYCWFYTDSSRTRGFWDRCPRA